MLLLKRFVAGLMLILFSSAGCWGLLNMSLHHIDPWGADAYFTDLGAMFMDFRWNGQRYTLPDGDYQFRHWSATMHNGVRVSPDADHATSNCQIAVIGDSATFGHGVDDADTYVNQLNLLMPSITFLNYGINGYNSSNIRAALTEIQAVQAGNVNGYLYLLINNDADPAPTYSQTRRPKWSLEYYVYHWTRMQSHSRNTGSGSADTSKPDWFYADMAFFSDHPDALIVGFDSSFAWDVRDAGNTIALIPPYKTSISHADPHADALAHHQIAADMAANTIIQDFLSHACDKRTSRTSSHQSVEEKDASS